MFRCPNISSIWFLLLCLPAAIRTQQLEGPQNYNNLSTTDKIINSTNGSLRLTEMQNNGSEKLIAGIVKYIRLRLSNDSGDIGSLSSIKNWLESNRGLDSSINNTEDNRKNEPIVRKLPKILCKLKKQARLLNLRKSLSQIEDNPEDTTLGQGDDCNSFGRKKRDNKCCQGLTLSSNATSCYFPTVAWFWPLPWTLWG